MDAKRVRGGLLAAGAAFVAVLVVALLLFFVSGDEADLSYRSVDFDAQLQSNGDIRSTLPPAGLTPTVRTMTNKSKSAGTFPPPSNRAVSNST